jgi:geranylgeranyl diphosphate synthase type I
VQLLQPPQLSAVEQHLRRRLEEVLHPDGIALSGNGFRDLLTSFVLDDAGKRVRPQLVIWAACLVDGELGCESLPDDLLDLAAGWELFHAFLLVHDDIIDAAGYRRRRPSLHRRLAELDGGSETFGVNLGIVAGDLLFAAAMRLWHSAAESPRATGVTATRLLATTSRVAMETGVGQAVDIAAAHQPLAQVTEQDVLDGYRGKTAAYTFEGPLLSGAILGGLPADACKSLSRFSVLLGQAYQIQNDLLDLQSPVREGCDLMQGKRTLPVVRRFQQLPAPDRVSFEATLDQAADATGKIDDRLAAATRLHEQLLAADALQQGRRDCDRLLDNALSASDDGLPKSLREGLQQLVLTLRHSYFR